MDDVEREAQEKGYEDGRGNRHANPKKHGFTGHLKDAYHRGHRQGKRDHERDMDQLRQEP